MKIPNTLQISNPTFLLLGAFARSVTGGNDESGGCQQAQRHHCAEKNFELTAEGGASIGSGEIESEFLIPPLKPGELSPFVWRDDGKKADEYGRLVGLPPQLTSEIRELCDCTGLTSLFYSLSYADPVPPGENRFIQMKDGSSWSIYGATGPGTNWIDCGMHWIDAADEATFEENLKLLGRGGFDQVLDAMGNEFEPEGYMSWGLGFVVVSHCGEGRIHSDVPGTGKDLFNFYFPLILPAEGAQLIIGDEDHENRIAPVDFKFDVAFAMSGDTRHGTASCDHRGSHEIRVAVTIYLADVNDDNIEEIAGDDTGSFPVDPGGNDWTLAQKGRLWGGGKSLKNDRGRKPFDFDDSNGIKCSALAEEGKCNDPTTGPASIRSQCPKSCKVYIEDKEYYSRF